jgi:hypothetical protein
MSIFERISPACQHNSLQARVARFEFQERGQLFIGVRNETLSVAAMCVCNPDRSPVEINR